MKLTVDFSELLEAVAPLGELNTHFQLTKTLSDLLTDGIELATGDISLVDGSDGILSYQGHQVMLYIPDQGNAIDDVLADGKCKAAKRIHIAECQTLADMRAKGRFNNRYIMTNRSDGQLPVHGTKFNTNIQLSGEAGLAVCRNCLTSLNYKNFSALNSYAKSQLVNTFSFHDFFECYSSYFSSLPNSTTGLNSGNYTSDWPKISADLRSRLNFCCEHCGVNLSLHHHLLHAHHINGNKSDNRRENLRALCVACHKNQPHHEHLFISSLDIERINYLRRKQNKFDVFDYSKLHEYVDTSLQGLTALCERHKLPIPELGHTVKIGQKYIPLDICWPQRHVVVLINKDNRQTLKNNGWMVFNAFDAVSNFDNFQSHIR